MQDAPRGAVVGEQRADALQIVRWITAIVSGLATVIVAEDPGTRQPTLVSEQSSRKLRERSVIVRRAFNEGHRVTSRCRAFSHRFCAAALNAGSFGGAVVRCRSANARRSST